MSTRAKIVNGFLAFFNRAHPQREESTAEKVCLNGCGKPRALKRLFCSADCCREYKAQRNGRAR